jgi:hypothetical protein
MQPRQLALLSCALICAGACGGRSSLGGVPARGGSAETLILQAFGGPSGGVTAQVLIPEPGFGQEETCAAPLDAGACQLSSCQPGGTFGSPTRGFGNLGPMSASVGTTTVPLTYGDIAYGTAYFPASITLGTGGTMTFRGGDGAGVPTFDVSATIPGLAVITSPAPPTDGGAAIIDPSQDLSVAWLPISIGQVHFELKGGSSSVGGSAVSVACAFESFRVGRGSPHAPLRTEGDGWHEPHVRRPGLLRARGNDRGRWTHHRDAELSKPSEPRSRPGRDPPVARSPLAKTAGDISRCALPSMAWERTFKRPTTPVPFGACETALYCSSATTIPDLRAKELMGTRREPPGLDAGSAGRRVSAGPACRRRHAARGARRRGTPFRRSRCG